MSWSATDVSVWLLQLVPRCINAAADDQSFLSYFQHIPNKFSRVCLDKFDRMIKRLPHGFFRVSHISSPRSTTWAAIDTRA